MIDVVIEKEVYVIEYLLEQGYGVSRRSTAIFGWEGVEHSFESMAAIEAYVLDLLEMKKPNQAPEPTAPSGRGSS